MTSIETLPPDAKFLASILGYYIDVSNEDKYLVRVDGSVIGPDGASECEVNMWMMLEVQLVKRRAWSTWAQEMVDLRTKFHTEHMLSKADSDRLDQLIVMFGVEFNDNQAFDKTKEV